MHTTRKFNAPFIECKQISIIAELLLFVKYFSTFKIS